MKLPILWLYIFCCLTFISTSQTDSLQRYLIPPPVVLFPQDSFISVFPIGDIPGWPIEPPPIYPPLYPEWWGNVTLSALDYYYVFPSCGDTYHKNGKLSSRINCKDSVFHGLATYWNENGIKTSETNYDNGKAIGIAYSWSAKGVKTNESNYVNGKQHGKTIHWDNTGHKLYEYTYAYGRLFKQKEYGTRGQLSTVEHYTYTKTGEQVLHGICINYSENAKEINRYKNGKFDGISQWFENGKLIREQLYRADYLQDQKKWNANQQLIGHNTYSKTGQIEHLQDWDTNGVLIKEQFHYNDHCVGTWLSYYPPTDSKTLTYYTDSSKPYQLIKKEVFEKNVLMQKYNYSKGRQTDVIHYYANGHQKFHTHTKLNNYHFYMGWNTNLILTDSITWHNDKFMGTGFYSEEDTTFKYNDIKDNHHSPIQRWALLQSDTLRQDYIINSSSNRNQILQSNYYAKNKDGDYVRAGIWSFYKQNNISHALSYTYGNITGRSVYYIQKADSLYVKEYGFYKKGIKHGKWTVNTDTTINEYSYINNALNGLFYSVNIKGDTLISGNYTNNQKNGNWNYYNSNGILEESGEYKKNQRIGKWSQWYTNEKGARKKRRVKY